MAEFQVKSFLLVIRIQALNSFMMGSGLPLNRVMSGVFECRATALNVDCMWKHWKKVSRVNGGWELHTIRQLY